MNKLQLSCRISRESKLALVWLGIAATFLFPIPVSLAQTSVAPDEGIQSRPPATYLLRGAKVIVSAEREIDGADVLVRDGKIVDVGSKLNAPPEAEIIDLQGKLLYPAFIDAYVEHTVPKVESPDGHWNTHVQAQRRVADSLPSDDRIAGLYRKAGFGTVLLAPSDGLLKGTSSVVTTARRPVAKTLLKNDVFHHLQLVTARGERGSYPSSPMGAVALVRQTLIDANWYQQALQAFRADTSLPAPDSNVALEALAKLVRGEQQAIIDGQNELYALRADRMAREFSLSSIIRGSGREYRQLAAIAATGRTFIIPIDFPKPPEVNTPEAIAAASLQSLMHWYLAPENPSRLDAAGVHFVITATGLAAPSDLLANLRQAVERGLSEKVALEALTSRPAKLLQIDHLVGALDRGKLASFIVTDGPLFKKSSTIVETWVQGERYAWKESSSMDATGRWQMKLEGDEGLPSVLELQWDDMEKPKVRIGLPGELDKAPPKSPGSGSANEPRGRRTSDDAASTQASKPDQPNDAPKNDSTVKPGSDAAITSTDTKKDDAKDSQEKKGSDPSGVEKENSVKSIAAVAELKPFSLNDYRSQGLFESKKLKVEGAGQAQFSATLLSSNKDQPRIDQMIGRITWPDGRVSTFTGSPVKKEKKKDKENKDQAASDKEKSTAATTDGDEKKNANGEVASTDSNKTTSPKKEEKLCDVNYPLGAYGVSGLPEQAEWILVQNATIWTCDDAGIIEDGDLLVHRGIIQDVGKDLQAPKGAIVIDAKGKHVSAGIIDCHSHMATDGGVNESAQAITAEVRIGDFIDPSDITIYRQLAGGVTTANILHGSANPIGGQNQVIKLRWGGLDEELKMKEAPAGIKFALGENVTQSNLSGGDRTSVRYPQSRMGVEQLMRDRFEAAKLYKAAWSNQSGQTKQLPPRRDLELEAIAEILDGKRWIHCHSYRQDEILTFLRTMEGYGVTVGSLQHILEGYKVADAIAKHGATASSFSDWWAYKVEVWDAIPYNGALLHRAGVIVSFNSDDDELARHLNHEAAKAIKYGGLSPEEAIKFVTLNPAKQLRIDKYVGSLTKGKQADFVIWSSSPLSTMSRCEQTWVDGRKYFDRDSDTQARSAAEKLTRTLVQRILDSGEKQSGNGVDRRDPSLWFDRFDAFCHHHHDEGDHDHDHEAEDMLDTAAATSETNNTSK